MLIFALGVVMNRNPVSSALSLVMSFLGLAALFVTLNAFLIGTIQILVYAGAVMVLFLFIIMLLDIKAEERRDINYVAFGGGIVIVVAFIIQIGAVLANFSAGEREMPKLAQSKIEDVKDVGRVIFTDYNFHLQVIGVLLLVATVGVVVLSRKQSNQ